MNATILADTQNAETTTNAADLAHVRALREFLAVGRSDEVAPSEQASRPAAPPLHTARAGLSPFFVELLDSLAGQLEPLQPTLTSASAFAWMAERARSLRRMRAFLTRPRALDVASGHETFVWDLLRSPYRPRFEIVITDKRAAKAEAVMRQTLITTARRNPFVAVDRLAPILDVFSKNMILRDGDAPFSRAMRPFLHVAIPGMAPAEIERESGAQNIWLIEYAPATAPTTSRLVVLVGFAGNDAEVGSPNRSSSRVLVLDTARSEGCAVAFDNEWQRVGRAR